MHDFEFYGEKVYMITKSVEEIKVKNEPQYQ